MNDISSDYCEVDTIQADIPDEYSQWSTLWTKTCVNSINTEYMNHTKLCHLPP